ncbi:MAG: TonB-dependent receptor plug domain-containing protein, partial [Bacteroidetes bacterium]|nr:TonB-dependent receptor plug domain-containing protein [Bacteroidota bacterium]
MKKFSLLLTLTIAFWGIFPSASEAIQENDSAVITGKVVDENGENVPNATVALYNTQETVLIKGTSSSVDGTFSLNAEPGQYTLRVSFVSYRTFRETIDISADQRLEIGRIELASEEAMLDEILVEGERSYMQMNFDSRTFNVGKDITSLGGSVLDVLDNVPSITVDYEGNVALRGNNGVQVLINGRPSSLVRNGTDALSSIPANLIEEVEIITNPSARFSAEGTAGI